MYLPRYMQYLQGNIIKLIFLISVVFLNDKMFSLRAVLVICAYARHTILLYACLFLSCICGLSKNSWLKFVVIMSVVDWLHGHF
jgi:hypothetical protein